MGRGVFQLILEAFSRTAQSEQRGGRIGGLTSLFCPIAACWLLFNNRCIDHHNLRKVAANWKNCTISRLIALFIGNILIFYFVFGKKITSRRHGRI